MCNCKRENEIPNYLTPDIEGNASEVIEEEINEKITKDNLKDIKLYDSQKLPTDCIKTGETPILSDEKYFPELVKKHMTPKDIYGVLKVLCGELEFLWNDENKIYTVDKDHPLIIEPERYHHVIITGRVQFIIEFYKEFSNKKNKEHNKEALRPGEKFIH
ncbi:DUF1971 domain-containing protein [uncultured Cetobacterium sp.]|uniref:DUF1971 domain-containing protein n=1 Tax=uncultured Cetobacterium sp. TaxID=527638 RepID=UPI0026207998|nr:DUF1971 domain-containing protein [uncultured Cetobacterium sp.]